MTRSYNTLGRRILRILTEEYGGERKRSILLGLAGGSEKRLRPVLARLLKRRQVVVRRCNGGQRYGLPRKRAARPVMHSKRQAVA